MPKVIGGRVEDEFSSLVRPQQSIPYEVSRVNGITDTMVAEAPPFDKVLAEYYGISTQGAHRALNDCHMNRQVYEKLGLTAPTE